MNPEYTAGTLTSDHDLSEFDSGNLSLNSWLRNHALRAVRQGTAMTTVLTPVNELSVVGYYSLAPTEVNRNSLTSKIAGGNTTIPAYLLARLALDQSVQGIGLGAELLSTALDDILSAANFIAGRVVVVDAVDETALRFYEKFNFRRIPNTMRLVRLLSDIRESNYNLLKN